MTNALGGGVPIKDVLSGAYRLLIPEYQRDYAWDPEECAQLIGDFCDELPVSAGDLPPMEQWPSYYLGTIVLAIPRDDGAQKNGGPLVAEIVDGQQRLATLTILLSCLRDLEKDQDYKAKCGALIAAGAGADPFILSLRGRDGEIFRRFVQPPGATSLATPTDKLLRKSKIVAVRKKARELLGAIPESKRRAMVAFVAEACRVAVVTTATREQAWRVFGRVNQRGKPLRISDILKALIIGAIPPAERKRHLETWDDLKAKLGTDFDDDAIGRKYLFSYIAELGGRSGSILDSVIAQVEANGPVAFMDNTFAPIAQAFLTVIKQDFTNGLPAQCEAVNACLKHLSWLANTDWVGVAILLVRHFSKDPDALIRHLSALDCYMYGHMLIGRNRHKLRFKQKDRIKLALKSLAQPMADLDLKRVFAWQPVELKLIRDALNYGLSGGPAKAILARLAYKSGEASLAQCDTMVQGKKWEVEHMVPISPQAGNDWGDVLGDRADVGRYAKKLGNLFIVSAKLNNLLENGNWSHKSGMLAKYPDEKLLPASGELRTPGGWSCSKIDARHGALIESAVALWQLEETKAPKPPAPPKKKKARRPRQRSGAGKP